MYLVDGTSLCYRSHFAIKLNNSSGFPTGAAYGFYRTLKKVILEQKPDFIGVCFDVSKETHRQQKYKEYKKQRPPLPDELGAQLPVIKKLTKALGIKTIEKEGFEADDVINSLCKEARKENIEVVVVTTDKDFFQLLSDDGVSIYNYKEHKFYRKKEFKEKYGFSPRYMSDYLSLAGDASDNIPGAMGIGKVGAAKLVKDWGSIDNMFKNIVKLKPQEAEKIEKSKQNIVLSKELVDFALPKLNVSCNQLKRDEPDQEKLSVLFNQLEFKIKNDQFFNNAKPEAKSSLPDKRIKKGLKISLFAQNKELPLIYFIDQGKAYVYIARENETYQEQALKLEELFSRPLLEKVTFDLKKQMLSYPFLRGQGKNFDIKIAAYLIDSSLSDYSLASLVSLFLDRHYSQIEIQAYPYFIWQLYKVLKKKLSQDGLDDLFYKTEMPLVGVLSKMEKSGINIDTEQLKKVLSKTNRKINTVKKIIFDAAGEEFNLNSPKQLQEILFGKMAIKPVKKTKTGYSTNEEVLKELALKHPLAQDILQYRELSKLKNTYLSPLIGKVESSGGRLFARFNQTGAQTGRISSSSPNLQSIPAKGEFSFELRKAFLSSYEGGFIVCGDYSQIELRLLACLSGDDNLIEAFKNNSDIHCFTASLLFGLPEKEINDAQRSIAKKVNFGVVYGMSSYGLSKELGISLGEADKFIHNYFSRYPKVKTYIEKTIEQVEKKGYVETIFKRRRKLPQIHSSNPHIRDFAKRQAVNAPIQGSCADIIKMAMVKIDKDILEKKMQAKLIMQIHDELVFDVKKENLKELIAIAVKRMENCLNLPVELKVNIKAGKSWAEAEEIK